MSCREADRTHPHRMHRALRADLAQPRAAISLSTAR